MCARGNKNFAKNILQEFANARWIFPQKIYAPLSLMTTRIK
jgi:hypothetical protein